MDVAGNSDEGLSSQEKRRRVGDFHLAFVAEEEVVKEHAQWRNPDWKSRLDATQSSVVEGVDAAISAGVGEVCNRVLAQDLTEDGEKSHGDLVSVVKEGGLNASKQFKKAEIPNLSREPDGCSLGKW